MEKKSTDNELPHLAIPRKPKADIVDLTQWLNVQEALQLRADMSQPMTGQSINAMADAGKIGIRWIKGVKCFAREDVINYVPQRGRRPKSAGA